MLPLFDLFEDTAPTLQHPTEFAPDVVVWAAVRGCVVTYRQRRLLALELVRGLESWLTVSGVGGVSVQEVPQRLTDRVRGAAVGRTSASIEADPISNEQLTIDELTALRSRAARARSPVAGDGV